MAASPRPFVEILEQPVPRGFRFRYQCEGRSAGSIMGENSSNENKTFPKIKVHHTNGGPSIVVVSCVTNDEPARPHPHNLVGKDCQKGVCTVRLNNTDVTTFPNVGIQCCKRKDIPKALQERQNIRVDPFATGFNFDHNTLDLSVVRLCFQVFLKDDNGKFTRVGKPAVSHPIYDKKSKLDLGICRISRQAGCVSGGEEVILLCEKVSKDNIEVCFAEYDEEGVLTWEGRGEFGPQDVHRQYAIVFRSPPYRDRNIRNPVNVLVFLRRPSDAETSESLEFQYTPENRDPEGVEAKKARKRLYQDVESNTIGLRQPGAVAMNFTGMTKAEPQSGRDALRDKLRNRNPATGSSQIPPLNSGFNLGYNVQSCMNQQLGSGGNLQGFNYMTAGGSAGLGIPQASALEGLPGIPSGELAGLDNTLNALNTEELLTTQMGIDVNMSAIKVEDTAFNSGQIDSDQLHQMFNPDNLELDQLLTDLGEMGDMNGQQDSSFGLSQLPDQGTGPHL